MECAHAGKPEFDLDRLVLSAQGRPLGIVDKIIYEPFRQEVLALVVSAQRFGPSKPHPIVGREHITAVAPLAVQTDLTQSGFQSLPLFREDDFRRPPNSWSPPREWSPRRVRWPGPDLPYPVGVPKSADRSGAPAETISADVTQTCCPAGSVEREWREQHHLRFEVDPLDVLRDRGPTCCRTPYEWGDASNINPALDPEPVRNEQG